MNFYVSIVTQKKRKIALDKLLHSLPQEWKYIIIYQGENTDEFTIFDDGHIEVSLKNNIYNYGNWVGCNLLLTNNIIPKDSWFLFIHDTCRFLPGNNVIKTNNIIQKYHDTNIDILWLSNNGQNNICLIRRSGIAYGKRYGNIMEMSKKDAILYECSHNHILSPKCFNVNQHFLDTPLLHLGKRYVYNNFTSYNVILFQSINIEKYYRNKTLVSHSSTSEFNASTPNSSDGVSRV
jgi:hypothetical protein